MYVWTLRNSFCKSNFLKTILHLIKTIKTLQTICYLSATCTYMTTFNLDELYNAEHFKAVDL